MGKKSKFRVVLTKTTYYEAEIEVEAIDYNDAVIQAANQAKDHEFEKPTGIEYGSQNVELIED